MKKNKCLNRISKLTSIIIISAFVISLFHFTAKAETLSKFDLRDVNAVTSVKNQGSANTCWAFAAIGAIESSLIVNGYADNTIDLSESHLAWFASNAEIYDESDLTFGDGCTFSNPYIMGGNDLYVTWALSKGIGLETEAYVGYDEEYINYTSVREDERYVSEYTVTEVNVFEKDDIKAIKKSITSNGALMASYMDSFSYYNDGKDGYCFFENQNSSTNHAILIIGWDDNFSKDNFGTLKPSSNGAWLCRNTRGDSWGDNGYFWISYETESLKRIVSFKASPIDDDIYQIYQYDGFGYSKMLSLNDYGVAYISNIYDITQNGKLNKIAFYAASTDLEHQISVYSLNKNYQSPTDGKILYSFSKKTSHIGYYLCELQSGVKLNSYDTISIVIKIKGEGRVQFYSEGTEDRASTIGKSFVSSNAKSWIDTAENNFGNLCIKAWVNTDEHKSPDLVELYNLMHPFSIEYAEDNKLELLLKEAQNIIDNGGSEREIQNNFLRLSCLLDKYSNYTRIETEEQFNQFAELVNSEELFIDKLVVLLNDLDFTDKNFIQPERFGGTFNGKNHTIKGIVFENDFSGFFKKVLKHGVVKNTSIKSSSFYASNQAGGICAINYGLITDCSVDATLLSSFDYCGSISGLNDGIIQNCSSKTNDKCENFGSIAGNNLNGYISNCISDSSNFISVGNTPNETYRAFFEEDFLIIQGIGVSMNTVEKFSLLFDYVIESNSEIAFTGFSDNKNIVVIGDVNGDGILTASDYLIIKSGFLEKTSLTPCQQKASDVNLSNAVETTDYILIKSHFLNIINIYGS